MTYQTTLRDAVRLALTAGLASSLVAIPAHAEDDDAAKLDRVEVTGSRIKRTQLEGAMPVTSVTREQIEKTGINSIGDLLQELPAAGAALNTNFNNGGDGSTRIDLRNLGSNRVLVLVNGRRWVNAVGGGGVNNAVDLNTIPISIIERIEVLKDGASAVYGSDAIAGVVNIITRRDFDGAAANATVSEFDEGDGRQELFDFSIGASTARSSAFLNATYFKAEEVAAGDRDISKEPLWGTGNVLGSSTTPNGRVRVPDFGAPFNGAGATRDTGGDFTPSVGDFRPYTPADAYNFAPDNYLGTPNERWGLYAQGRHDLTDNVTFTSEALYTTRKSEQLLAAMPVTLGPAVAGINADGAMVGISATNPFNIFGQDLDPVAANPGLHLNGIQRRFVETGGRSFNQDVALFRFGAGLEGNFEAFGRVFDWNVGYTFTEASSRDITYGLLNTAAIRTALGPIASCTAPCVPMNLFGGAGSITQSMLDFVTFNAHDLTGYEMRNYTGNISGEVLDLPAGPVGLALGYEWRQEHAYDDPDALIAAGNTTGNARSPTAGGYALSEMYAEVAIPVLSGLPFAEVLEIQLAARSSDYETFGSTTNTKFGFRWQPFSDLLVRGTFQEGFRAPSVGELFLGQSDSFPSLPDPCSNIAVSTNNQLIANCTGVVTGGVAPLITGPYVPADGSYVQSNPQIRITVGGNPGLLPETAESTTFGFVYSPGFVEGLSVSLDWYDITLDGAIQTVGAGQIMQQCYGSPSGSVAGGNQNFCNLLTRFAGGDVEDLLSSFTNVSTFDVGGIDLNVVYRAGELPFVPGEWKFTWDTAFVDTYEITAFGATQDFVQNNVGDTSIPAFKSNLDIEWSMGDWEATWRMRFIGRQYEFCSSSYTAAGFPCSDVANSQNAMGATTYHNVQVSYHLSDWDTRFTFGVQNIGDKKPPLSAQAFANSFDATTYEVPGRVPYFRVSKTF
jgi:iron complex outermembrane receptor protein